MNSISATSAHLVIDQMSNALLPIVQPYLDENDLLKKRVAYLEALLNENNIPYGNLESENPNSNIQLNNNRKLSFECLPDELRIIVQNRDKFTEYANAISTQIYPYIVSQQNKNLWDIAAFFSKLYGFVKKTASREKIARLFVLIVPALGDAKALEASMAKCTISGKHKIDKYYSLPKTDQIKSYESTVGKSLADIL